MKKTYQVMTVRFRKDGDYDIVTCTPDYSYTLALKVYRESKAYISKDVTLCLSSTTEDGDGTILYKYRLK